MKENIETKDVQRTEYLDKNGLDMLWAKVKENTHNQVEVERNRAVAKENSIADTKADKSALGEYIKIASNTETKVNGVIRTVDVINNNIGFGDNESSLAYIGKGEIGIASYKNGYAMESFRYTTSYGLVTTNISGYKNIAIPCDRNVIKIYEYNSEAHNTNYGYNGVVLGENNDDSNLLNTNGSYKTIGTDITPLENGKVPAEYLDLSQYAKKTDIPEVDTSNFVSKTATDTQIIKSELNVKNNLRVARNNANASYTDIRDDGIVINGNGDTGISIINTKGIVVSDYSNSGDIYSKIKKDLISIRDKTAELHIGSDDITSWKLSKSEPTGLGDIEFQLRKEGIRLYHGDDNHVLTSNASTIDITQYVLKSVYDEKIAALEARIAALEAKHTETA